MTSRGRYAHSVTFGRLTLAVVWPTMIGRDAYSLAGLLSMRLFLTATLVAAAVFGSGCAVPATPTVGTIASCGPGLDAATCRDIAQVALSAYQGPALSADRINVDVWASCDLPDVMTSSAEAAKNGTTCYSVTALAGTSGGRRVAEGEYQAGKLDNIDGLVWADADGTLHAATNVDASGH